MRLETIASGISFLIMMAYVIRLQREQLGTARHMAHPRALLGWGVASVGIVLVLIAAGQIDIASIGGPALFSRVAAQYLMVGGMLLFVGGLFAGIGYPKMLRGRYDTLLDKLGGIINADSDDPALIAPVARHLRELRELLPWMRPEGPDRDRLTERIAELERLSLAGPGGPSPASPGSRLSPPPLHRDESS